MLRRLILMRHADAQSGSQDHARALSADGERQAARVAHALCERGWLPQRVLASDAARTTQTWQVMARSLAGIAPLPAPSLLRALYLASPRVLAHTLAELDDAVATALVLGHNPGISDAASDLCEVRIGLAPACAALLEGMHPSWPGAVSWRLVDVVRP